MGVALRFHGFRSSSIYRGVSSEQSHTPLASSFSGLEAPRCRLLPSSSSSSNCRLPSLALICRRKSTRRLGAVVRAADGQGPVKEATEVKAATELKKEKEEELRDGRILPYCSIDQKNDKRTLGELEADFLEALQSFYYEGKPTMSNEEFDNLKEELTWEGSTVVMLSSDEHKFMEASLAYQAGKPIISDAEYDTLKLKLKRSGSQVAIEGPRCSIRSRRVVSDSMVDYLKMTLLNVPAALFALGLVFFLDDITGFEITYLLELPEPYSFIFTWFIVLPITYLIARSITNLIVKDPLILRGPCPNCGANTTSFFGTILTVESGGSINTVKCEACGSKLLFDINTRLILLDPSPPEPPKKGPAKKSTMS